MPDFRAQPSSTEKPIKAGISHPLLFTACLIGGLNFCSLLVVSNLIPIFVLSSGVVVSVVSVAAWSVFGTGNYLSRLLRAHLLGSIPMTGVVLAFLSLSLMDLSAERFGPKLLVMLGTLGYLFWLASSVASQICFWGFRASIGWQFVANRSAPEKNFSIADIMLFTFLIAMVITAPQIAAWSLEFAATSPAIINWQGLPFETSSEESIGAFFEIFFTIAALSFTITLFSAPLIFFCLIEKSENSAPDSNGLAPTFFYWLVLAIIINLLFLSFSGLPAGIVVSLTLGGYFAYLLFVLSMMRHGDISLTWPRRFEKLNSEKIRPQAGIAAHARGPFE